MSILNVGAIAPGINISYKAAASAVAEPDITNEKLRSHVEDMVWGLRNRLSQHITCREKKLAAINQAGQQLLSDDFSTSTQSIGKSQYSLASEVDHNMNNIITPVAAALEAARTKKVTIDKNQLFAMAITTISSYEMRIESLDDMYPQFLKSDEFPKGLWGAMCDLKEILQTLKSGREPSPNNIFLPENMYVSKSVMDEWTEELLAAGEIMTESAQPLFLA